MVALRINVFGGMIPAQDDHLLPDGGAALAQNTWFYNGTLDGMKTPRLVRTLSNSSAQRAYRIPNDPYATNTFSTSVWLEFTDADVEVLRAPVRDDSYKRYYWLGPSTTASYNTYDRIAAGSASYKLGVPQPGTAPTVTAPVTPDDTVAPVKLDATINGALIVINFTEERRLDALNAPPATAFRVTSPTRTFDVMSVSVDGPNRKVYISLSEQAEPYEAVTVAYTDPSSGDDALAIQDEAGNDSASFSLLCTNNTVDKVGPKFWRADALNNQLIIYFTDANALDATNVPATSAFRVYNDGVQMTISSLSVDGPNKKVTLTLSTSFTPGAWVTFTYIDPSISNDPNAIQDTLGNDAPGFTNIYALNLTTDTTGPNFAGAIFIANQVTIVFDEELDANSVPLASQFSINLNGTTYTPSTVSVSGPDRAVYLQLPVTSAYGQYMNVSYTGSGTTTRVKDVYGNWGANFSSKPARNDNANLVDYVP